VEVTCEYKGRIHGGKVGGDIQEVGADRSRGTG